jgi:flavorubredoxin
MLFYHLLSAFGIVILDREKCTLSDGSVKAGEAWLASVLKVGAYRQTAVVSGSCGWEQKERDRFKGL